MHEAVSFKTTHLLPFECAPWRQGTVKFRIGTCNGLYSCEDKTYCIIAIINSQKGNGHFTDVLEWFENSAKRDGYDLKVVEIWNKRLFKHLIDKRGFKMIDEENVIKTFKTKSNGKKKRISLHNEK